MKYSQSDFVVYRTKHGEEVFTWVKNVFEEHKYYILDFEDTKAIEDELSRYDAPNFTVPDAPTGTNIDEYHRETMIDRIITALQPGKNSSDLKVSKLAGTIIFETVITDPKSVEDQVALNNYIDKYNRIVAKVQGRFNGRWGVSIPAELHFPLNRVSLYSIRI